MTEKQWKTKGLILSLISSIVILSACETFKKDHVQSSYPPGSIGYIHDSCRLALKNSSSHKQLLQTYCGNFISGLLIGGLTANWIIPTTGPQDKCVQEKEAVWIHMKRNYCAPHEKLNLFSFKSNHPELSGYQFYTYTLYKAFSAWSSTLEAAYPDQNILSTPVTDANRLSYGKIDCALLEQNYDNLGTSIPVNKNLLQTNWKEYFKNSEMHLKDRPPMKEYYFNCKHDLEYAEGSDLKFRSTNCGAEILGFMAGMLSTDHLQYYTPAHGKCAKEVNDLHEGILIAKQSCITPDTNPERIARTAIESIDEMWNNRFVQQDGYAYKDDEIWDSRLVKQDRYTYKDKADLYKKIDEFSELSSSVGVVFAENGNVWRKNMCPKED